MSEQSQTDLTDLIHRAQGGDGRAFDALFRATYDDLRTLAHERLRHDQRGTLLDTTALVHEQMADIFWRDFAPENRWAGEAAFWLARCQDALGHRGEARDAYNRANRILAKSPFPADAALVASSFAPSKQTVR